MKPQALQEAIKAQALRKAKSRENKGWKEPVVKKHQVTAEEMKGSARRVQTPAASTPYTSAAPTADMSGIQQRVSNLSADMNQLKMQLADAQKEIKALQAENKELLALKAEMAELKRSIQTQTGNSALLNQESASTSPPASPVKTNKPPASMEPHTSKELVEHQRKDKVLREFMKTKQGLYDPKYLSLREVDEGNIVCFKRKIYIPKKLRDKSISHYKREFIVESMALAALRKNCCWPELEKDFFSGTSATQ